ncbi:hypothetical protein RYX36_013481, partial [Vicia faba]
GVAVKIRNQAGENQECAKVNDSNSRSEFESLKTKDREQVAVRELEKVVQVIKRMPEIQEKLVDLGSAIPNNDELNVENPLTSKTKGRPKGEVEIAKKPRRCHVPNCGGTNHDSRKCPNKKKNIVLPSQSPNK